MNVDTFSQEERSKDARPYLAATANAVPRLARAA
jgi:hypothetical protein